MIIILRIILITLLFILTSLLLPDLRLGGRYLMLAEAVIISLLIHLLGLGIGNKLGNRQSSIVRGFSLVAVLYLVKFLIPAVNLTILGILFLYFSVVLLEMILPQHEPFKTEREK